MRSIISKSIIVIAILITSNFKLLSQGKINYEKEIPAPATKTNSNRIINENSNYKSLEVFEFEDKMKKAKESGDLNESIKLQSGIDKALNTKTIYPKTRFVKNEPVKESKTDISNFDTNKIYTLSGYTYQILSTATCTEQRGNNLGRIWTIANMAVDGGKYTIFSIGVFYSDDNGVSWTKYGDNVTISWAGGFVEYEIDAEIIEGSGGKYLWIIYDDLVSYIGPGGGLLVYNLSNGDYGLTEIYWPTYDGNFKLKLVSDNSQYINNSWVYLVSNYRRYYGESYLLGEQVALCMNPYTVSPVITYKEDSFMGSVSSSTLIDFNCDIAYFRNGSDSIMIVESSLESNSAISIGTASIFSFLTNSLYRGTINTSSNVRSNVCISSNGAYNNLIILCSRQFSFNDWDIEYYHSTNGSAGWLSGYADYTYYNTKIPKIIGQRNAPGKFYAAFNYLYDSPYPGHGYAAVCKTINYVWNPVVYPASHIETSFYCAPSPAVPNPQINNDVSLAVWSDDIYNNPRSLWISRVNNSVPKKLFMFGAIQGLYDAASNAMIYDTVTVYLRNSVSPFAKIDSSKKELYGPGTGQEFTFPNAQNNVPYYVEVKHRNALETWSADPVTFVSDNASIAFSVDAIYAYGNNQIQVDNSPYNVFAFYSGDVNQDGTIDASDVSEVDNDSYISLSGYVNTDVTGDDFVDAADVSIVDNNAFSAVSVVRP